MELPLVLTVTGSSVAILSVITGGIFISRGDKTKRQLDKEMINLDRELSVQRDLLAGSELKVNFANTLLYILQFTVPVLSKGKSIPVNVNPIVHNMISAMTDRYRAAKGKAPDSETIKSWEALARKKFSADHDEKAWEEMVRILNAFIPEWQANYNNIGQRIDELKVKKSIIDSNAEKIKYISFGLQIAGLIIVVMKDLFK